MPQLEVAATRGAAGGAGPYRPPTLTSPAPSSLVLSRTCRFSRATSSPALVPGCVPGLGGRAQPLSRRGWPFRVLPSCRFSDPSHVRAQGRVSRPHLRSCPISLGFPLHCWPLEFTFLSFFFFFELSIYILKLVPFIIFYSPPGLPMALRITAGLLETTGLPASPTRDLIGTAPVRISVSTNQRRS